MQTGTPETPEGICSVLAATPIDHRRIRLVHLRWMIEADLPRVVAIEGASFTAPWTPDYFKCFLAAINGIGMVAEANGTVVGYLLYELLKAHIRLVSLAVLPDWRRHYVGHQLVARVVGKLIPTQRCQIELTLRESNLVAQQFFRSLRFPAVEVLRGHYEDTGEDGYRFLYELPPF